MNIVFRADASLVIGTGHVMRCLTLAGELRSRGAQCTFICRPHPGHLIQTIQEAGFDVAALRVTRHAPPSSSSGHGSWLGTTWEADAADTASVLGSTRVDRLVVDHYALDARWETAMHSICERVIVIDDLADRRHDCNLLLDQNLARMPSDYDRLLPVDCDVRIGPEFALLRNEFQDHRPASLRRSRGGTHPSILVSMGGVDSGNATQRVLQALWSLALPHGTAITAVMGPHAPHVEHIRSMIHRAPVPARLFIAAKNMAQLMAESDLAIGAAGTSALERCCLGLPSFVVVLASNQERGAHALRALGAAELLPDDASLPSVLQGLLLKLSDRNYLQTMQEAAQRVTDGRGASRFAEIVLQ